MNYIKSFMTIWMVKGPSQISLLKYINKCKTHLGEINSNLAKYNPHFFPFFFSIINYSFSRKVNILPKMEKDTQR